MNQTNLFEQSTSENKYLFGNTTTIPFSSSNLFGSTTVYEPSLFETKTLHRTESLTGLDKFNKNDIQITSNFQDHQKSTTMKNMTSTSFLFDIKPPPSIPKIFTFGDNQPSSSDISSLSKPAITSSTTTTHTLFSTMSQPKTMINRKSSNNEVTFLPRNIKPNVTTRPQINLYSTPFVKSTTKRKYDESILDDNDDLFSKINIKRPRMLDMNKIRSIILGNNEQYFIKSSNENRFSTYDEYILSKKSHQQSFCLPRLTHYDYYTEPSIEKLKSYFNEHGQCFVKEFTIIRKHYGSVKFQGLHMNLAGLDLDRLVQIDRRQVTVYPNEKDRPNEGEELNCQAIISLIGVYPIDRTKSNDGEEITNAEQLIEMNYGKYLEQMTKKFQGHFLNYDVYTGTWTFQVEHF